LNWKRVSLCPPLYSKANLQNCAVWPDFYSVLAGPITNWYPQNNNGKFQKENLDKSI
jgi:hypothetical protein